MSKRNLAFYKKDETKWTVEEFKKILNHTGSTPQLSGYTSEDAIQTYVTDMTRPGELIYDTGRKSNDFMHTWAIQDYKKCEVLEYHEFFNKTKLKIYKIKGK